MGKRRNKKTKTKKINKNKNNRRANQTRLTICNIMQYYEPTAMSALHRGPIILIRQII